MSLVSSSLDGKGGLIVEKNRISLFFVESPDIFSCVFRFSFSRDGQVCATQKLGNSNVLYYIKKNPVEPKHCETSSSYMVFYLIKLKPQKAR